MSAGGYVLDSGRINLLAGDLGRPSCLVLNVGNSIKREENSFFKFNFFQYLKNS